MTDAAMFFVQQKMRECGSSARSAAARVRQARTLREVRDWGNVHVDGLLCSVKHMIPELKHLAHARADRAKELVELHLEELRKVLDEQGLEAFRARAGARFHHDWNFLRGEHANLYRFVERELANMEHRWGQKQKLADSSAEPPQT